MPAYYNEIDPYAAQWLRNLISAGHIADGVVDERSIEDVHPIELREFDQCHFFAGVGVWSRALRLAGWPDGRPVWTGSCPCQPFSAAGKGAGFADERHLWPAFHHLIAECRPAVVFGEQVASKDGLAWFDLVRADLEATGYAAGAADLCAAGVGAPHIRQRLFWVADADHERRDRERLLLRAETGGRDAGDILEAAGRGESVRVADADDAGLEGRREPGRERTAERAARASGVVDGLADAASGSAGDERQQCGGQHGLQQESGSLVREGYRRTQPEAVGELERPGPTNGHWRAADWLACRDGKWRPVEPGTFPLAHGVAGRVGRLRAYGNAIVPQVAACFIEAYLDGCE